MAYAASGIDMKSSFCSAADDGKRHAQSLQ
jgi:hypothetical protein